MDSIYPLVVTEAAAARHGIVRVWDGRQHPYVLNGMAALLLIAMSYDCFTIFF